MDKLVAFARKYTPRILEPYAYEVYLLLIRIISIPYYYLALLKIRNEPIFRELSTKNTIHILQPTFYNLDGTLYLIGGAERYLCDLSKIIIGLGYTPLIVQYGSKFWHLKHNNIDVIGIPSGKNHFILNKIAHNKIFGKPHLRIYSPFTLCDPIADPNSIGISHGIFWDQPHYGSTKRKTCKHLLRLPTLVSVDTSTLMYFRSTIPEQIVGKDMRYIPNYVDLEQFHTTKRKVNKNLIITIPRRLYKQRGYFLVEQVIPKILKKHNNVEFHFVGQIDASAAQSVRNLLSKFPQNVTVYEQPDHLMPEVYQKSDITLIPTVASEGTSLSCIEAMATGNAIIATNVGGLPNLIIDGYNGVLISPEAHELEEALDKLISSPELRTELGQNALSVVKAFDKKIWEARWQKLLLEKLIK